MTHIYTYNTLLYRARHENFNIDFYAEIMAFEKQFKTEVTVYHHLSHEALGLYEVLTLDCAATDLQTKLSAIYRSHYRLIPIERVQK